MPASTANKLPPTAHPSCGTYSGRGLHSRRGETPCQPCKDATAARARIRRATADGRLASNEASRRLRAAPGYSAQIRITSSNKLRVRTKSQADGDFQRLRPHGKACRGCGELLPAEAFARSALAVDGRQAYCSRNDCSNRHYRLKRDGKLAAHWLSVGIDPKVCIYCLTNPATDLEHVFPRALGGLDEVSNYAPACQPCNSAKSKRHPLTYLAAAHPDRISTISELFPHILKEKP